MISNSSGYSVTVGTESPVTMLAPGETVTETYAVYNVVGYNNPLHLNRAVYEVLSGTDVEFEIIETDMDLYDTENALEKVNRITQTAYYEIVNHSNYLYMMESLEHDSDTWAMMGEAVYLSADAVLSLDLSGVTGADLKQQTRVMVKEILEGETPKMVVGSVNTKYLEAAKEIMEGIADAASGDPDLAGEIESYCEDLEVSSDLIKTLMQNGVDSFVSALAKELVDRGLSNANEKIMDIVANNMSLKPADIFKETVEEKCGTIGDVFDTLDQLGAAWNTSAELSKDLIQIAATQEEALALLELLMENNYKDTDVYEELKYIQENIQEANAEMVKQFVSRAGTVVVGAEIRDLINIANDIFGTNIGATHAIVAAVFSTADEILGWGEDIDEARLLRVGAELSISLATAVSKSTSGSAELGSITSEAEAAYLISAIKYLIKMRLISEQSFITSYESKSEAEQEALLVKIRKDEKYASCTTLEEYLSLFNKNLLTIRDNIFATYYENTALRDAPEVTLNLAACTTNESFSSEYEYSFDGVVWEDCTGTVIPYSPSTVSGYLLVRLKESAEHLAGNFRKVDIPAIRAITGYVSVTYNGQGYSISGLNAGEYLYAFANDRAVVPEDLCFTAAEGETVILTEAEQWNYLVLQMPATATAPASLVQYFVPETVSKDWDVDTGKQLVVDVPLGTTVDALSEYYTSLGYRTFVADVQGKAAQKVGTGCTLYLNGEAFTVVVPGDVDGDAQISTTDLTAMLAHINSVDALSGAYLEAGCLNGNSDVDIFDIYSVLKYINDGIFGE